LDVAHQCLGGASRDKNIVGGSNDNADPTIYDVAGRVGVSAATVSRALNPGPNSRIKSDTIRRIVDAAAELGYQPNRLARSLKSQKSRTIGLLVADMMNSVFMPTVHGVQGPLEDTGYIPIIMNIGNDPQRIRAAVGALF
jgi:LacI family transcriptional regulator